MELSNRRKKLCFGLLPVLSIILGLSLSVYSDAFSVQGTAEAHRFLYAVNTQYNTQYSWTEGKRYNEYTTYAEVAASQINTLPGVAPTGKNLTISGKMNISFVDRTNQYYPYTSGLQDMTVVCGWGNVPLATDGASVTINKGNWSGTMNNSEAKVTYLDVTFNWSGHFTGDYNNVSATDTLSCNVRRKTYRSSSNYYQPFAVGTLNNTYVYADNSSYNSYLSYSSSDDQDLNAIQGVEDAVVNLNNTIIQQNEREQESLDNISNQTSSDIPNAESQQTTSLINFIGSFVTALGSVEPSSCELTLPFPQFAGGTQVVNICNGKQYAPSIIAIGGSLLLIGTFVPLAYIVLRLIFNEIRSWTNG